MKALINRGLVWQIWETGAPDWLDHDIRDVSDVPGIAEGWTANADGTFAPPPAPDVPARTPAKRRTTRRRTV